MNVALYQKQKASSSHFGTSNHRFSWEVPKTSAVDCIPTVRRVSKCCCCHIDWQKNRYMPWPEIEPFRRFNKNFGILSTFMEISNKPNINIVWNQFVLNLISKFKLFFVHCQKVWMQAVPPWSRVKFHLFCVDYFCLGLHSIFVGFSRPRDHPTPVVKQPATTTTTYLRTTISTHVEPPPQVTNAVALVAIHWQVFISFQVKATKSNGGFSIEILGCASKKSWFTVICLAFRNENDAIWILFDGNTTHHVLYLQKAIVIYIIHIKIGTSITLFPNKFILDTMYFFIFKCFWLKCNDFSSFF